jgi:hypothetical protein
MLPEIVEAVGDKLTVLFDSGIRTGVDIIKALSLGAQAVLVGRPVVYGMAVGGKVRIFLISPPSYFPFSNPFLYFVSPRAFFRFQLRRERPSGEYEG